MDVNLEKINDYTEIRHSTLAKVAFFILVSMIIPLIIMLLFRIRILPISIEHIMFPSNFLFCWIIGAPILSLKLSITDLKRPDRLRLLPKVTFILSSIIVGIGLIFCVIGTIHDLSRII